MNLTLNVLLAEEILIKTKRGIQLNPHWETKLHHSRRLFREFTDEYDWCESGMREMVYCIINDVEYPPCCKCGNPVQFNKHRNKYNTYCSRVCCHKTTS